MADVTAVSRDRVEVLSKRVARLTLVLSSHAAPGVDVQIDGAPASIGAEILVDPGHHHVKAMARGVAPFEGDIVLPAGGRASFLLSLDPPVAPMGAPQAATTLDTSADSRHDATRVAGWVTVGSGTLLLVAAVTSLALRESDIAEANRRCPDGGCVGGIDAAAQAATERARVEGPLGWSLGAAALAGLGVGAYLVLRPARSFVVLGVSAMVVKGGGGLELRAAL
ncbi:MAG TPA: hypothetical protein VGL81_24970 [Polyangiaceae bacterium]